MTSWSAVAAALFAGIGLVFAGIQLLLSRRLDSNERRIALEGVAVTWRAREHPDHADADGTAEWLYEITLHNPARLPIERIQVRMHFPCPVRRVHYSRRVDEATQTLTLQYPVLAGLAKETWRRRLRIDFAADSELFKTWAEITFHDVEGVEHANRWPRTG